MNNLYVDFNTELGAIKPMNAVNNGPVYKASADQRITNMDDYKALCIPYARNHDASFCSTYGGNFTVDVNFIFPNWDADPYDENSYDFACTDEYIRVTNLANTKTFYRLGSKIEHEVKKHNTVPPKDFKKWAVICEHIIRHYNYGWADGFHHDIEYWEIWNEPDNGDRCWGGTYEEFIEFYNVAANHLKKCFPELKIGGCAFNWDFEFVDTFLGSIDTAPDFLSWHIYTDKVADVFALSDRIEGFLNKHGLTNTESILNEWNYIAGWNDEMFLQSVKDIMGIKGAAFAAAVMSKGQYSSIDMLMYYDARPCAFNGLWAPYTYERLKCYYTFAAFAELYKLGTCVKVESSNPDLYMCAAKNNDKSALMITSYGIDTATPFELKIDGNINKATAKVQLLDETHDLEIIDTDLDNLAIPQNAVMLITFG